jgi:hypothetical protein
MLFATISTAQERNLEAADIPVPRKEEKEKQQFLNNLICGWERMHEKQTEQNYKEKNRIFNENRKNKKAYNFHF